MNNTNSTDTRKPTGQVPFVKKGESHNDAQPAKVEAPTPGTSDTDRKVSETKPTTDDESGKSLR